ncbi:Cu-binding protein [Sticta canariensis]|nr:Cu-binding protein [Sticta canariensis]
MSRMIDLVSPSPEPVSSSPPSPSSSTSARPSLLPLFITCDPARDTPSVLKAYLSEFHPSILGLTGTWEQVRQVCKAYRVYFSTPEGVKPGMDYLVDHSIYFYLMGGFSGTGVFQFPLPSFLAPEDFQTTVDLDQWLTRSSFFRSADPEGDFIEAIGRQHSAEKAARIIREHMSDWKDGKKLS